MSVNYRTRIAILSGLVVVALASASVAPSVAAKFTTAAHPNAQPTCNSSQPCLSASNADGGAAIRGDSQYGQGIVGTTHADPGGYGKGSSAVYGRDLSTYGRTNTGVTGISITGTGVYGHSIEGAGVSGSGNPGVFGDGYTFGDGFWPGVLAVGGAALASCTPGRPCPPALAATSNYAQGSGVKLFAAYDNAKNLLAYIDDSGNLFLNGQLYTSGSCKTGCIETGNAAGKRVVAYAAREASPSIEDFGEGQLTYGEGFVRINSDFAATIDPTARYFVFVTPHANSLGLYVTNETSQGFWVRENGGGRTTSTFDYRIVGKPLDSNSSRLPEYRSHDLGKIAVGDAPRVPSDAANSNIK